MSQSDKKSEKLIEETKEVFSLIKEIESIDLNSTNIKEFTQKIDNLKQKISKNLDPEK